MPLLRPLPYMVPYHLVEDEAQEFFAELGIEFCVGGECSEAGDLFRLTAGIGGGQPSGRLVRADVLRDLEALGEHKHQRGVDVVDAVTVAAQGVVGHRSVSGSRLPLVAANRHPDKPRLSARAAALKVRTA